MTDSVTPQASQASEPIDYIPFGKPFQARHGSRVWCWGSNNMGPFGVECGGSFSSPRRLTMLD